MSPQASVTPLCNLRVSSHLIPALGRIPNTALQHKPLLIYHSAFHPGPSAVTMERYLSTTGIVDPEWRDTMYDISHFHSTAHEVLCVATGRAKLCFGGVDNPARVEMVVQAGDVMIVPAGVAHQLLEDVPDPDGGGFCMVGSYYPKGRSWDMCYGRAGEEEKVKAIERIGWFEKDPIYGDQGPVLSIVS